MGNFASCPAANRTLKSPADGGNEADSSNAAGYITKKTASIETAFYFFFSKLFNSSSML
jgi:hypothetical protein